jgi:oligopeptide transport system permease protein
MIDGPQDNEPGEDDAPAEAVVPPPAASTPESPQERAARAEERQRAHAELVELKEHWQEREQAYDTRDAGHAQGEETTPLREALRRFRHNRVAVAALFVIVLMALMTIFVPMTDDKKQGTAQNYAEARQGPSADHWFGTDHVGRDLWHRAWRGGRISLAIGFATALTILIVGVLYGSISGYAGGRVDNVMMRFLDALYGLPYIPFAIILGALIRAKWEGAPALVYMVPALSLTTWFTAARIMRGQVLSLKENEYVEAARSMGARGKRVLFRHVVPNTLGVMIVAIFLEVPGAILGEAVLSFLSLGVQPPETSWGRMAYDGKDYFGVLPHMIWVPALLIGLTVLCTIAVADGMRAALDPRGKQS